MGMIRPNRNRRPAKPNSQSGDPVQSLESRRLLSASFATPNLYGGVADPTALAEGVLVTGGKPDVVVAGYSPSSSTVPVAGVYLNNGDGTFGTPTIFPFSGTAAGIALGDFLGNGNQDIAMVDSSTNTLDVFLNNGQGDFTPGAGATLGGTPGDTVVATGDFNGDGKDDVAVVDPNDQSVQILFSNGNSSFTAEQTLSVPSPKDVIVADFNNDAHPDLAILSGNGSIYVALNEGNGMFAAPAPYPLGQHLTSPTSATVANLTSNTPPDLVAAGTAASEGSFVELINQGAGTFSVEAYVSLTDNPAAVVAGNFSGTGNTDLAFLGADGSLTVLPGNGNGTFGIPTVFTNELDGVGSQAIAANFTGGSTPDIAYLSTTIGETFGVALDTNQAAVTTPTLIPAVSKSTLPTTVVGGIAARGTAALTVTNFTSAAVRGPVTTRLYASEDGSVDSSSILIGSVKRTLSITVGGLTPVSISEKLPTTMAAGTYTLLAQTTDPSGNITTANAGPSLTIDAPVIALTESFQRLVLPPSVVSTQKTTAAAEVKITNGGNTISSGITPISLYASPDGLLDDATLIKTISRRIAIAPGRSVVEAVPLGAYPNVANGNYFIVASVTNPLGTATSVVSSSTINIAAAFIDLTGSLTTIPATGVIGKSIVVTLELTNSGNTLAAGLLQITFAASPNSDGSDSFDLATLTTRISLKPGVSRPVRLKVPLTAGISTGSDFIIATVDPNDAFADNNAMNNVSISVSPISLTT